MTLDFRKGTCCPFWCFQTLYLVWTANIEYHAKKRHAPTKKGVFLLQIGWGTGYNANTVTTLFTDSAESPVDWMDLRERFRLGESRSLRGAYDEREFQKTRRILYSGQNPIAPSVGSKFHSLDCLTRKLY